MNNAEKMILDDFINQAVNCNISSNLPLSDEEKRLLFQLNQFAIMQTEDDMEVVRDPRKIFYKSEEELKTALVGLGLAVALTKNFSRRVYTKEFFEDNIRIERKKSGNLFIHFGAMNRDVLDGVLTEGLIFDWMVYSDNKGRGLLGLADYKGVYLDDDLNFRRGGSKVYEFARFERKCYRHFRDKVQQQKDDMQDAFRKVFAEAAAKQLSAQIDPVEFTAKLFNSQNPAKEIENMLKSIGKRSDYLEIEFKDEKNDSDF